MPELHEIVTLRDVIDANNFPTWKDIEPSIRQTSIGYRLNDLRSHWVIRYTFNDDLGPGYLLASSFRKEPQWGELFDDDMLVFHYREARKVAKLFVNIDVNAKTIYSILSDQRIKLKRERRARA